MSATCEICGKTFDNYRGLNGHMNAHDTSRARPNRKWTRTHITTCSGGCLKTFLPDASVDSFTCRTCAGRQAIANAEKADE